MRIQRRNSQYGRVFTARDAAGRIVTDAYGGSVINVEEDTDQGKPVWEVEATGGSCGRIEVDVDKASGSIVSFETED